MLDNKPYIAVQLKYVTNILNYVSQLYFNTVECKGVVFRVQIVWLFFNTFYKI